MQVNRRLIALGAASAILIAACSGGGSASPSGATIDYKACVAFDTGGLGDKGFNDLALKGLNDAKAAGYETAYSEAQGATDYAANIQRLIDEDCETIIAVGFAQGEALNAAVTANPEISFGHVDASWPDANIPANYTGLDFQIDEAAMLAGYLAAGFSETGKIGTYGGQQFPGVTRFMDGLYAGIKLYNERKSTSVELLGWNAATQTGTFVGGDNPWNDPAKGEQLAKTFLDQGVDIVHPVSGATGNGTIKAMLAAGKYAIGVDTDQAISLAEYAAAILTSAEKVIDVAVLETIKKNAGGDMGGENFVGTIANGGVRMSPYHDFEDKVSDELKKEVEDLAKEIADGTVKVADYMK